MFAVQLPFKSGDRVELFATPEAAKIAARLCGGKLLGETQADIIELVPPKRRRVQTVYNRGYILNGVKHTAAGLPDRRTTAGRRLANQERGQAA